MVDQGDFVERMVATDIEFAPRRRRLHHRLEQRLGEERTRADLPRILARSDEGRRRRGDEEADQRRNDRSASPPSWRSCSPTRTCASARRRSSNWPLSRLSVAHRFFRHAEKHDQPHGAYPRDLGTRPARGQVTEADQTLLPLLEDKDSEIRRTQAAKVLGDAKAADALQPG